ncbi:hypothetical protein SK128_011373 [Halocaridina rubra]|uniref:Uncharacterized protein n=1 Tax=Halocaridina rubra TaxID=373956 RepID=A0AAN8WYU3_HALRR
MAGTTTRVDNWNSLSEEVVNDNSTHSFKDKYDKYHKVQNGNDQETGRHELWVLSRNHNSV